MSYSDYTVQQMHDYVSMLKAFDFSSVDWPDVVASLQQYGYYTPQIAAFIEEFSQGRFDSLSRSISLVDIVYANYPPGMSFATATESYLSSGSFDYSSIMPNSTPPSVMNWGAEWKRQSDQLESPSVIFDDIKGEWKALVENAPEEWSRDSIKNFLVAKSYESVFSQSESFLSEVFEKAGFGSVYRELKSQYDSFERVKKLNDTLVNFSTKAGSILQDGMDAISGKGGGTADELNGRFDELSFRGLRDFTDFDERVRTALQTIGTGFLGGTEKNGSGTGYISSNNASFKLTIAPITGIFHGGAGNDGLFGGNGADIIAAGDGRDVIYGAGGNDTLLGGAGNDWLLGGGGNDLIYGGMDSDRVIGGAGNDRIFGEAGNDILTGSAGIDYFHFEKRTVNGRDTVTDFVSRYDKLEFNASEYGFKRSHILTSAEFHVAKAPVGKIAQFYFNATDHTLYFDVDGSGKTPATALVVLDHVNKIGFGDFLFV